jgi:hypothetical protein
LSPHYIQTFSDCFIVWGIFINFHPTNGEV